MAVQESFFPHLRPDTVMSSFSKISVIFPPHASTRNGFQHIFTAKSVFFFGDRFHRIRVA